MVQVPVENFLNRVLISEEHVLFTTVDPYGHLNTSRYVEMFVNHRIYAAEKQAAISTITLFREFKIALVFYEIQCKFLFPSLLGESLKVASWSTDISKVGFRLRGVISGEKDSRVKAVIQSELRSVGPNGKMVRFPTTLPCEQDGLLADLPQAEDYMNTLVGLPTNFY